MERIIDNDELVRSIAQNRSPEERELTYKPDRIGKYLVKYMDDFIFVEFSDEYLKACGVYDFMKGISIPLRKTAQDYDDAEDKDETEGYADIDAEDVPISVIGENMAFVMGTDPKFVYNHAYKRFIFRFLGSRTTELLCADAGKAAEKGDMDRACILFRAALVWMPDDPEAMFGYARVCGEMYQNSSDEEYIGNFKAESFDYFELLTELHPELEEGWYYLGYMYLNFGLYSKSAIAWEKYLNLAEDNKRAQEIRDRLNQIEEPIKIEKAYNLVLGSRWEEGLAALTEFTDGKYKDWWPLWYYIGVANSNIGNTDDAIEAFTKVLRINGSQIATMNELIEIYEELGDEEMVTKYTKKIEILSE